MKKLVILGASYLQKPFFDKANEKGFHSVFHYLSLHSSEFYKNKHDDRDLTNSDNFSDCLVRLPMYYELDFESIKNIVTFVNKLN